MTSWLERKWDLLRERVREELADADEPEPDYFDSDIGPMLYAIDPARDSLEREA